VHWVYFPFIVCRQERMSSIFLKKMRGAFFGRRGGGRFLPSWAGGPTGRIGQIGRIGQRQVPALEGLIFARILGFGLENGALRLFCRSAGIESGDISRMAWN
jgi:hypothetical protein